MSTLATPKISSARSSLLSDIIKFILPLMATNLLQQLYHSSDVIIVGISTEPDAMGAVGSTSAFLMLIVNLFIGFSVGGNIVVSRCIGLRDEEKISRAVHTSITAGFIFGVIGAIVGIILAQPVLVAMGYSGKLLTLALRYTYIYLTFMPLKSLNNFLAAIFQAQKNTKTTLYVFSLTGLLNVGLNLVFVLIFGMSVEGVAIATVISEAVSCTVLWSYLGKKGGTCKLSFKKLRLYKEEFIEVARIGFPSGIQQSLFSISNLLINSSILEINNAMTPAGSSYQPIVKGHSASGSIESFIFTALGAVTTAASVFTARAVGERDYRKVRRSFGYIAAVGVAISTIMSVSAIFLRDPLLLIYGVERSTDGLAGLAYYSAVTKIFWKWHSFFIFALMNATAGTLRGLGRSSTSALIALFGTCVLRVVWIYTVYQYFKNLESIFISYPISWMITFIFLLIITLRLISSKISENSTEPTVNHAKTV